MLDALRDFIAKVKTALGGKGNAETAELEQGAALWQRALETSSRNTSAEGDGKIRYSIGKDQDYLPFPSQKLESLQDEYQRLKQQEKAYMERPEYSDLQNAVQDAKKVAF